MKLYVTILKRICVALWWLMVVATAFLLINVLNAKIQGKVPTLCGYSVMRIVTGSMEPEIATGDYILVKECDPSQVRQGDIISFYSREIAIYGMPNTHRVIEAPISEGSGYTYITKGDKNIIADALPVSSEQLIGVYVGTIDWLTSFAVALDHGLLIVILAVVLLGITGVTCWTALKAKPEDLLYAEPSDGELSDREVPQEPAPQQPTQAQAPARLEKEDIHGQPEQKE